MRPKQTPRRAKRQHLVIALIALVAFLLPAIPAQAIIGNTTRDVGSNPAYPYVGGVWKTNDQGNPIQQNKRVRSTGILIAPNVVLTEGASYQNGNRVAVSFESPIRPKTREHPLYQGYLYRDPQFDFDCGFSWCGPVHDVAVIILDEDVAGIDPASLADIGALDAVDQKLDAVSYGPTILDLKDVKQTDFTRRAANDWQSLAPVPDQPASAVRLKVPDQGLTCNGDQGGPILQGDDVVALIMNWFPNETNPAGEGICDTEGVAYGYRLDTQDTRDYLCIVANTDFATVEIDDPAHPGQNVPYPDVTLSSREFLVDAYSCDGDFAAQTRASDADDGKQGVNRKHNGKHKKGGHHRNGGKHRN